MNCDELATRPLLITENDPPPGRSPAGTLTTICVSLQLLGIKNGPLLKNMPVTPGIGPGPKFAPAMVTWVPEEPLVGLMPLIVGCPVTVMFMALVAPCGVVICTATEPETVSAGMNAWTLLSLQK